MQTLWDVVWDLAGMAPFPRTTSWWAGHFQGLGQMMCIGSFDLKTRIKHHIHHRVKLRSSYLTVDVWFHQTERPTGIAPGTCQPPSDANQQQRSWLRQHWQIWCVHSTTSATFGCVVCLSATQSEAVGSPPKIISDFIPTTFLCLRIIASWWSKTSAAGSPQDPTLVQLYAVVTLASFCCPNWQEAHVKHVRLS